MTDAPLIMLAAGGTGGHLFPAEALGVELIRRGFRVRLATDGRALRYSGLFSRETIDVVPSATVRGRMPWSLAYTGAMLAAGTAVSLNLMRRLKPAAVVGFGGYPTLPPLLAAKLSSVPGIIHEANAVLGRANRFLDAHLAVANLSSNGGDGGGNAAVLGPGKTIEAKAAGLAGADATQGGGGRKLRHGAQTSVGKNRAQALGFIHHAAGAQRRNFGQPPGDWSANHAPFDLIVQAVNGGARRGLLAL